MPLYSNSSYGYDGLSCMVTPFINNEIIKASIKNLSNRQFDPSIRESDYTLITSLILNHYFPLSDD